MQLPGLLGRVWPQAPAAAASGSLENLGPGRHVRHHVDHLHGVLAGVFWSLFCRVVLQVSSFVCSPGRGEQADPSGTSSFCLAVLD